MSNIIDELEKQQTKETQPEFNIGDTLKVSYKVIEGKKERIQAFEGVVICIKNAGIRKSFTVRKVVGGIGVEKTYLFNSPRLADVAVIRKGKARKARLFYLREKVGAKANRIKAKDPRMN